MNDETAIEDAFIDFKCPCCGEQVSFPAASRGSVQECFNCTEAIVAPKSGDVGGKIPLPIATPRLALRKFRGADWKDLLQLFSDEEFFAAAPFKLDGEEQIARWMEEDAVVKLTSPGAPFILALQLNENGKVIGCASLSFSDGERVQAVLSIVLHRDFQRQGFGAEAAAGLLEFCFNGISLHRVQAFCDSTNTAACRLAAKAGMRQEGEFVQDHKVKNQWANTTAYATVRDEFKKLPGQ